MIKAIYNRLLLFASAMMLMLIADSCATSKSSTSVAADSYVTSSVTDRFDKLAASYGDWTQLNVPIKVAVKSPTKLSASGRAYMLRDKAIYISMRFLGMEVATAYIDTDSIIVCDKFNHRYVTEGIRDIMAGADITISDIQNLLLGRAFINGDGTITSDSKVNLKEGSDGWTITPRKKNKSFSYAFTVDNATNSLSCLDITAGKREGAVSYADAYATSCGTFMSSSQMTAAIGKSKLDATITYTFKSAKFADVNIKKPSLSGYERVSAEKLIKALSE